MDWSAAHSAVGRAFTRLAAETTTARSPDELVDPVERALACDLLSGSTLQKLRGAWDRIRELETSVLRHRDASPQNCLFRASELTGVVDWENSSRYGAPGFDLLNFALALVEHGVGLTRWSEDRVVAAFRNVWTISSFGREARAAARQAAATAGVPVSRLDALEHVFFARRLGQRLATPTSWAVGPRGVARMVEIACAL
jgi:hypothetical protein